MWLPTAPLATQVDYESISAVTITGDGTAHTKGGWTQLVATAPFDVMGFTIGTDRTDVSNTNTAILLDIGIGASSSEIVLVADILAGGSCLALKTTRAAGPAYFPVYIASGTRISARLQGAVTTETADVTLMLYGGGSWQQQSFQAVDTLGANGATSTGVSLASSGIQEVIASTAEDYKALGAIYDVNGDDSTATANEILNWFVGAGGSEIALMEGQQVSSYAGELTQFLIPPQGFHPIELNIPAGSRLAAEAKGGSNTIGIVLYGFR